MLGASFCLFAAYWHGRFKAAGADKPISRERTESALYRFIGLSAEARNLNRRCQFNAFLREDDSEDDSRGDVLQMLP